MKKPKGFTLIELLVVISIIALLVAILMPALSRAKEQAKQAACLMNHRNLSQAWIMYSSENDDALIYSHTQNGSRLEDNLHQWVEAPIILNADGSSQANSGNPSLEDELNGIRNGTLYPYLNSTEVFHCPSDNRGTKFKGATSNLNGAVMKGPAYRSYSMICNLNGELPRYAGFYPDVIVHKMTEIRNPSGVFTFLDDCDNRGWNMGSWIFNYKNRTFYDPIAFWHPRKGTFSYADGHAETYEYQDKRTVDHAEAHVGMKQQPDNVNTDNKDLDFLARGHKAK